MISQDQKQRISTAISDPRWFFRMGIYSVMLLYPMTIFIVEELRSDYFGFLVLLSLIALGINKFWYKGISLDRSEILFLASLFMLFFVALVSYAYFGFQKVGEQVVDKYSFFLLAIPLFFLLRYTRPRMEIIWIGIVIGCYVAFGRALLEELGLVQEFSHRHLQRANGVMNAIRFGDISLLMGFIALAGSLYLPSQHKSLRLLGLLAFPAALGASFLSQSRGSWIAIPVLLLIVLWPYFKAQSKRQRWLVSGAIVAILLTVTLLAQSKIVPRFERAIEEIKMHTGNSNSNTSIGIRLFMIETAWSMFKNNPVFGVGVGNYRAHAYAYYQAEKPPIGLRKFDKWENPHNEYLQQVADRGIVGLATMLFAGAMGIYYFIRVIKFTRDNEFAATSGILVIAAYAQFGLTIALFQHRDFLVFFVIYLMMFFAAANASEQGQVGKSR